MDMNIYFPKLGIEMSHVGTSISIFGFHITYYGILMGAAILAGIMITLYFARKTMQNVEYYLDISIGVLTGGIIGARLFYVLFSWDKYRNHFFRIFNLRQGGFAFYGAFLGGLLFLVFAAKRRRLIVGRVLDTASFGIVTGQIIGRLGNFYNRESFGGYTNGLFAMQLPVNAVRTADVTEKIGKHILDVDGIACIQVHPVFLYEMLWNLGILILIIRYAGKRKFEGELFFLYVALYGIGRTWMEALRVDKLMMPGGIPVSLVFAVLSAAAAAVIISRKRKEAVHQERMRRRRALLEERR